MGLIEVEGIDPTKWKHLPYVVIDHELQLHFSLSSPVNRDNNSGLLLRGTVFTPEDRYLLVGSMGGTGIAVIEMKNRKYIGKICGISNTRHLIIKNNYLYASCNSAGLVCRVSLDKINQAIESGTMNPGSWEVCHVGSGTRTIEASPSGNYVFAACNSTSALYVVDTRTMKAIAQITVDSYPVGLHISNDGSFVVVTSQGRSSGGGNAVNLYKVEYATPEVPSDLELTYVEPTDSTAVSEDTRPMEMTLIPHGWQTTGSGLPALHCCFSL